MASVACTFCGKTFKERGLNRHQKYCKSKMKIESSAEPHGYKICLINYHVFECVLSFLSNQSLTKLQAITGDRYPKCERALSSYCCPCENDKLAVVEGLCSDCAAVKINNYFPQITSTEARSVYGVKNLPYRALYNRDDVEKQMIATYGSTLEWLRISIAKNSRAAKRHAKRTIPIGFAYFLRKQDFCTESFDHKARRRAGQRFIELKTALEARGFSLLDCNRHHVNYIMMGVGVVKALVDAEEV